MREMLLASDFIFKPKICDFVEYRRKRGFMKSEL
jgi:hypothetical protein